MRLYLKRVKSSEHITLGILYSFEQTSLYSTLELGWKDNQHNISCIPKGTYKVLKFDSPRFGKCLIIDDVPGRSGILIHSGNTTKDTHGCILLGHIFKQDAILNSRNAIKSILLELAHYDDILLEIS